MEASGTQTIATFTGTLLRREHGVGQKFVQLVFREGDKNWLCISSKLTHAKLAIGQAYKIEGTFKQAGDRAYIHEPRIALLKKRGARRALIITTSVVMVLAMIGGGVYALSGSNRQLNATNASSHTTAPQQPVVSSNAAVSEATTTDTTQTPPASDTTTTPAPAATTTKKASATQTKTQTTTPAATQPAAPAAYCDSAISLPFQTVHIPDNAIPEGSSQTVQAGAAGSQQTCYSDGTSASAQTTTTPATDEIIHDGTAVPA
jgi:flagellar basal body-associated protein FliL